MPQQYKVGDKVTIKRRVTSREAPTWQDSWYNSGMDPLVGKTGTIARIDGTRYYIDFGEEETFNFPIESFELFIVLPKEELIILKIKQMKERWDKYQSLKRGTSCIV